MTSLVPLESNIKKDHKLSGIHFGIVVSNNDPEQRGGVQVKIPGILECQDSDLDALPYVYPANNIGGTQDNNSVKIPQVGSSLFVEFIDSDPFQGFYTASLLGLKSVPTIFKEDYPKSFGETWSDENNNPSWIRINKTQEYVELFLNPSQSLIRVDKEGKMIIKVPNDLSFMSDKSINFIATKNINLKADNINQLSNSSTEKILNKTETYTTLNTKSINTSLDLGILMKKTISEAIQSTSISVTVPTFVINGILNSAQSMLGIVNGTPIATLFTGMPATYSGDPYQAGTSLPVTIEPQIDNTISSESAIQSIKELTSLFINDYKSTSDLMRKQSDTLRTQFKAIASKLIGSKNYKLDKAETNLLEELKLAEEVLILKNSLTDLDSLKIKMETLKLEATSNLALAQATHASKLAEAHSSLQEGFDQNTDYKKIMEEFDNESKGAVLDKFNSSAPQELKLTPPKGSSSFSNASPDAMGEWFGSVPTESFLPVVNGTIFNITDYIGLNTWVKTNVMTSMTNNKQKNIVPQWADTAKQRFNDFVALVRQIEIISCKIYELIKLIENLIKAITNLQINYNKLLAMLTQIEILLPTWILDLIKDLINQVSCGDLPKFCQLGSVSSSELESLPGDISNLLGKQNSIAEKGYRYLAHFETIVQNIQPTTDFLNSVTEFSNSGTDVRSGLNIEGL